MNRQTRKQATNTCTGNKVEGSAKQNAEQVKYRYLGWHLPEGCSFSSPIDSKKAKALPIPDGEIEEVDSPESSEILDQVQGSQTISSFNVLKWVVLL